jgi:excisionase family DNA binding protein
MDGATPFQEVSMNEADALLTYAEAAKLLHVQVSTLYSKVSRREIPHLRLGGASSDSTALRSMPGWWRSTLIPWSR